MTLIWKNLQAPKVKMIEEIDIQGIINHLFEEQFFF
jgi:hypothetical protein